MNAYKKIFLVAALLASTVQADLLETLGVKKSGASLDVILGNEKKSELASLQKDLQELEEKEKKFWEEHAPKVDKIKSAVLEIEEDLKKPNAAQGFLNKQLLLTKTIKQVISNIKSTWKEIIQREKRHISLLENYIKDPEFNALQTEKKTVNTFNDLQDLNEQIAAQEEKINTIQSEKNETHLDLDNRKKKETSTDEAYKEKIQQQKDFVGNKSQKPLPDNLDAKQYGQLLDLEVDLARYEYNLAVLRVHEEEIDFATVTSQLEIEEKKNQVLKKKRDLMVRMTLRVDEKDIALAKAALAEKKKEYLNETEKLTQQLDKLVEKEEKVKESLRNLIEKYKGSVEDPSLLTEWSTRPTTTKAYTALGKVGQKNEELLLIEREVDLLRGQISFQKEEFDQHELSAKIVESWYKIKHQKFKTNEDFAKELKGYESTNGELERERVVFEDKRHTATGRLNVQNKALTNIQELLVKVGDTKNVQFKNNENKQTQCLGCLQRAEALIRKQVEISGKLIEIYSKVLVTLSRSRRQVTSMIAELQRVNLWHRSGRAISWQGLGNLLPDLRAFLSDVKTLGFSYLAGLTFSSIWKRSLGLLKDPFTILFVFLRLLLALGLFLFIRRYLPLVSKLLSSVNQEIRGVYLTSLICSVILDFLYAHWTGFFIWCVLFAIFGMHPSPEIPCILFFLLSIFYLLYLSRRFTSFFARYNEENEYVFFSESFQPRFTLFLNWFLAATVIIFLFREAFILATYTKSELPDILLALYSIIIRVLLLSLIRKEDLLGIIPSKTPLWSAVWRFIDHYYYPVLFGFVVIMIMMDPHIGGYNNLVYYLVWGITGTAIVAKLCLELYVICRKSSSFLFFSSDGETLQERFKFSKILYGISVIFLFFLFSVLGIICIAWVWGRPVSIESIQGFFLADRMTITGAAGEVQKLSILDFLKTLAFIPFSFLVGYIVDRFVVHRIFSVLLVNPGVHNAVSTITYYIVVISVITIGLWSEGFGFVIAFYIAPIILGIAWALRDIFNDFVAYFVILIQRPLKIGDYITIDDKACGVVRNISPRAVVLRRKKGFCVIIPNSRIMRETITNWDYNLNFIACPDIKVMVPYRFNPRRIKQILFKSAEMTQNVLKTPPPIVRLDDFADSGFLFMIRIYISPEKTLLQWNTASDVRINVIEQLRLNGMEVAFPVRIVRMRNIDGVPENADDYPTDDFSESNDDPTGAKESE